MNLKNLEFDNLGKKNLENCKFELNHIKPGKQGILNNFYFMKFNKKQNLSHTIFLLVLFRFLKII